MESRIDREAARETGIEPEGLERVVALFRCQLLDEKLHPGASLTVRRHGRIVVEAWGGSMQPSATAPPVTPATLFLIFSATKPLTATAVHMLVERGRLDIEAPVAHYWPGFAQNGKEAVTVRHVLTHQGGFPFGPKWLTWEHWRTRAEIVRGMESRRPAWAPGTETGYHALNYGWVLGELIHRIDGRSLGRFLADEVFGTKTSPATFGHTGQGCTLGWGDPTRGLGVAYFTNGVQESVANFLRNSRMSDAILEATPPL